MKISQKYTKDIRHAISPEKFASFRICARYEFNLVPLMLVPVEIARCDVILKTILTVGEAVTFVFGLMVSMTGGPFKT